MSQIITLLQSFGLKNIVYVVIFLSIFIDISPSVKFNPWKAILNRIGKYINNSIKSEIDRFEKDVNAKIDKLSEDQKRDFDIIKAEQAAQAETLNNLIRDMNYKEMSRLRWEITDFETSVIRGNKYPREQYRHIIDEAEKYLRMCEDKEVDIAPDPEDIIRIKESMTRIKEHYESRKNEDSATFMI